MQNPNSENLGPTVTDVLGEPTPIKSSTTKTGNLTEAKAKYFLARAGYTTMEAGEQKAFDCMVDSLGKAVRIQIKTLYKPTPNSLGKAVFSKTGCRYVNVGEHDNRQQAKVTGQYLQSEFDVLMVVDKVLDEFYLIPIDAIFDAYNGNPKTKISMKKFQAYRFSA